MTTVDGAANVRSLDDLPDSTHGYWWTNRAGLSTHRRRSRWREPEPWIGLQLVVLLVILLCHNPIARALGTQEKAPTTAVSNSATQAAPVAAPAPVVAPSEPASGARVKPVPKHAPVDPFYALVSAQGQVLARPVFSHWLRRHPRAPHALRPTVSGAVITSAAAAAAQPPAVVSGPDQAQPAQRQDSLTYQVRAGDSLWSIAQAFTQTGHAVTWQQVYAANRAEIGPNPSLINVGILLHLPGPP